MYEITKEVVQIVILFVVLFFSVYTQYKNKDIKYKVI